MDEIGEVVVVGDLVFVFLLSLSRTRVSIFFSIKCSLNDWLIDWLWMQTVYDFYKKNLNLAISNSNLFFFSFVFPPPCPPLCLPFPHYSRRFTAVRRNRRHRRLFTPPLSHDSNPYNSLLLLPPFLLSRRGGAIVFATNYRSIDQSIHRIEQRQRKKKKWKSFQRPHFTLVFIIVFPPTTFSS